METNLTFQKYIYCWVTKIGILKEKRSEYFLVSEISYSLLYSFGGKKNIYGIVCKIAASSLIQFENILTGWWQCYRSIKRVSVSGILQSD